MKGYLYAAVLAGLIAIVGACAWQLYAKGKAAGIAECQAERVEAAAKAQTAIDLRDRTAATNNSFFMDELWKKIPPIQGKTDESAAKIITVYRDRVVAVDAECSRPDSVQAEIDAARDRANGAGAALQASPSSDGSAIPKASKSR